MRALNTSNMDEGITNMSDLENSSPFVSVILSTPGDDTSLRRIVVDVVKHAVCLFTKPNFAREYLDGDADLRGVALTKTVLLDDLPETLRELSGRGVTHVVSDPLHRSDTYNETRTTTIHDYLAAIAS